MNILDKTFKKSEQGDTCSLLNFFEGLRLMDERIKYVPLSSAEIYSALYKTEGESIDEDTYSLKYRLRGAQKEKNLLMSIDEILSLENGEEIIDILLADKDVFFMFAGKDYKIDSADSDDEKDLTRSGFFCTQEALIGAAKLCKLSGDALSIPSVFRDNYISELIQKRCLDSARKREPVPGFTAICIEDSGLYRALQMRSGRYKAIPQETLKDALFELLTSDDYGEGHCLKWYIDHDLSYADMEFPDVLEQLKADYPELPKDFPVIPGIRISTGSTGFNTLKVSMTYRRPGAPEPVIMSSVSQKHCETYDREQFITDCHKEIWGRYGELPRKLVELQSESVHSSEVAMVIMDTIKKIGIHKIFMCKSLTGPALDYAEKISFSAQSTLKSWYTDIDHITKCDIALAMMDTVDKITAPESYREPLRAALMKAAFSM